MSTAPNSNFPDLGTNLIAKGQRAVRPRNAATLILLRHDGPQMQVLMGRRGGKHSFMPDKWVFPGGRIDRADFNVPTAADLDPTIVGRLSGSIPANRVKAMALTAIRETYEEAGLLLGQKAEPRVFAGPWREFLADGVLPDPSALTLAARAVTPPVSPKRFDTLFFIADAARLVSLERKPDCGELDEIAWFTLEDALNLDLPSVTSFVLKELPGRLEDPHKPAPYVRFTRQAQKLSHL